ncbi:hypothetical protein MGG_17110 [Pyricularia oryzae 70-15]|uniref:Uncharacterized protein n=3 Tax=Pyricularia oryzae TaxID=318829 RepID=G4N8Y2_PYRO7|nr:uncharacterized protein MGG_17110 [Pyricularia oryzae 70-15]EHA50276.1 hypothetical protein MGG_17110 [Pyricularia oryzae 70-15]ELQ35106.1 hypothetical protein OOU_Y34scaffold00726g66 [Pyricularia oryzae Y34]
MLPTAKKGACQFRPTFDQSFQWVHLEVPSHNFLRERAVWKSVANAPTASEGTRGFAMVARHDLNSKSIESFAAPMR